jgi:hypothetical protein
LNAFLEFNVLVPEWVTLKIESDKMSTSFKKPVESARYGPDKRKGGWERRGNDLAK